MNFLTIRTAEPQLLKSERLVRSFLKALRTGIQKELTQLTASNVSIFGVSIRGWAPVINHFARYEQFAFKSCTMLDTREIFRHGKGMVDRLFSGPVTKDDVLLLVHVDHGLPQRATLGMVIRKSSRRLVIQRVFDPLPFRKWTSTLEA